MWWRKERKERCSPWECSSITGRLRPALSHCHSDATSTAPERSPGTSLHRFRHKKRTHCICAFTKTTTLPSVAPSLTSQCRRCCRLCHADTNERWYANCTLIINRRMWLKQNRQRTFCSFVSFIKKKPTLRTNKQTKKTKDVIFLFKVWPCWFNVKNVQDYNELFHLFPFVLWLVYGFTNVMAIVVIIFIFFVWWFCFSSPN